MAQTLCVTPDEPAYTLIRECDWVTAPGFDPEVDRCRKESFKALLDNIVKLKAYKDRLLAVIDCLRVEKKKNRKERGSSNRCGPPQEK